MKKNIVKRIAAITLTCAMALTLGTTATADAKKATKKTEIAEKSSGEVFEEYAWVTAKDSSVSSAIRALFDQINMTDNLTAYCPKAVLAYKLSDEGTTWRVWAEANTIFPEVNSYYTILEILESMEGDASIVKEYETMIEPYTYNNNVGWSACAVPSMADAEKERFREALTGPEGISLKPVAKLATQVAAGMNYCLICERTPIVPNAVTKYSLMYIFEKPDGTLTVDENRSIHLGMGDDEESD